MNENMQRSKFTKSPWQLKIYRSRSGGEQRAHRVSFAANNGSISIAHKATVLRYTYLGCLLVNGLFQFVVPNIILAAKQQRVIRTLLYVRNY